MEKNYKYSAILIITKEKLVLRMLTKSLEEEILLVLLEHQAELKLINFLSLPHKLFSYLHVYICYLNPMLASKTLKPDSERDI